MQFYEEEKKIDVSLEASKDNDPVEIEKVTKEAQNNKRAADRWTDNIWALKSYLVKKKGMQSKEVHIYMYCYLLKRCKYYIKCTIIT